MPPSVSDRLTPCQLLSPIPNAGALCAAALSPPCPPGSRALPYSAVRSLRHFRRGFWAGARGGKKCFEEASEDALANDAPSGRRESTAFGPLFMAHSRGARLAWNRAPQNNIVNRSVCESRSPPLPNYEADDDITLCGASPASEASASTNLRPPPRQSRPPAHIQVGVRSTCLIQGGRLVRLGHTVSESGR